MRDPQAQAEREIHLQLTLESALEEHEREESKRLEREWLDHIKSEVGYFLEYLNTAYDVKEETFQKHVYELFSLIEEVARFENRVQIYASIPGEALLLSHRQVLDDMHTSIFLAVHGKYAQAMSSLRRVLEVSFRAIEHDCRMAAQSSTRLPDIDEWLQGRGLKFSSKGGTVDAILDERTDKAVVNFLKKFRNLERASARESVKETYHELSHYIHVEPFSNRQIVFGFAEYDASLFDRWQRTYAEVILLIDLIVLLKFPTLLALSSKRKEVGFPGFSAEELNFLRLSSIGA
jgi:hypothetical protein